PPFIVPNLCTLTVLIGTHLARSDPTTTRAIYKNFLATFFPRNMARPAVEKPDTHLFTTFLTTFLRHNDITFTQRVLVDMQRHGVRPDVATYSALVNAYAVHQLDMDSANALVVEMRTKGLQPTVITYTSLIKGWARLGNETEARKVYEQML